MGIRSTAERDAITVEIGFAVLTAVFVAAAAFLLSAAPALFLELPRAAEHGVFRAAGILAGLAFVARVVRVLWRFPRQRSGPVRPGPSRHRTHPGA
ncbi:DUF6332 family protein [Streptomyces sp. NPDC088725]|uniref:DUF6332 family protein n=1 Tax=Streptomyces sp. NPDC088725 TaxID=3365873 RepID=UPI0037FC8AB8